MLKLKTNMNDGSRQINAERREKSVQEIKKIIPSKQSTFKPRNAKKRNKKEDKSPKLMSTMRRFVKLDVASDQN